MKDASRTGRLTTEDVDGYIARVEQGHDIAKELN